MVKICQGTIEIRYLRISVATLEIYRAVSRIQQQKQTVFSNGLLIIFCLGRRFGSTSNINTDKKWYLHLLSARSRFGGRRCILCKGAQCSNRKREHHQKNGDFTHE